MENRNRKYSLRMYDYEIHRNMEKNKQQLKSNRNLKCNLADLIFQAYNPSLLEWKTYDD